MMQLKHLITAVFFLQSFANSAQDTIYIDKYEAETTIPKKAEFYRVIRRDSLDKNLAVATEYFKSGKMKSKAILVKEYSVPSKDRKKGFRAYLLDKDAKTCWLYNGKYLEWYENGKLKKDIDFKNGGANNQLITYWPDGQMKRREVYDNSWKNLKGECFISNGIPIIFTPYVKCPVFDLKEFGSMQTFINRNLKYPKDFANKQIMGKMIINSFVNAQGKISKNTIVRGIEPEFDKEVSSLLSKMPDCVTPAMCDGEPTTFILTSVIVICKPIYTVDLYMNTIGNDTIFYNKDGFIQSSGEGAESKEILFTSTSNPNQLIQTIFYPSGKVKTISTIDKKMSIEKIRKTYPNLNVNSSNTVLSEFMRNRMLNGQTTNWYENGQLTNQLNYSSNKLVGEQIYYAVDGTVTNRAVFENGKLISGNIPEVKNATHVDIMPQFPGGVSELFRHLGQNTRYPVLAQERKISGRVVVRFVVETDGSISTIEVLRSVDPDLDAEAVRVIQNMPNWTPGMKDGVVVPVWFTLPVSFNLR